MSSGCVFFSDGVIFDNWSTVLYSICALKGNAISIQGNTNILDVQNRFLTACLAYSMDLHFNTVIFASLAVFLYKHLGVVWQKLKKLPKPSVNV